MQPVRAPMQGTVVSIDVREGDVVRAGQQLVVLESMKMEHVVAAEVAGVVTSVPIAVGRHRDAGRRAGVVDARRRRRRDGPAAVAARSTSTTCAPISPR